MLIDAFQTSSPALLFTSALSFHEFIEQNEEYGALLYACYQETRLPPAAQLTFAEFPDVLNFMVVAAADAPDTIMVLPVLQRIAEAGPRLDIHIVCEDDDLSRLMGLVDDPDLPSNWDELDSPLLLIFDEEWQYRASWGPRPQAAEEKLDQWLEQHPEYEELSENDSDETQQIYSQLLHKLTYEMRIWYNSGLRAACAGEIADLLQSLQEENETEEEEEASEGDGGRRNLPRGERQSVDRNRLDSRIDNTNSRSFNNNDGNDKQFNNGVDDAQGAIQESNTRRPTPSGRAEGNRAEGGRSESGRAEGSRTEGGRRNEGRRSGSGRNGDDRAPSADGNRRDGNQSSRRGNRSRNNRRRDG